MEKRITALSSNPHTVSLADRKCSLFIDPNSGSIFVDEGDGQGRMNGVVFSPTNKPSFSVRPSAGPDNELILDYAGVHYIIGVSEDGSQLRSWAESANSMLTAKGKQHGVRQTLRSSPSRMTKVEPRWSFVPPAQNREELPLEYVEC